MESLKKMRQPEFLRNKKVRNFVVWLLIAGLLILRIPFLAGVRQIKWTATPSWVTAVFEVGTYLLTAILIIIERDHLSDHHVDYLALVIIMLGKPLELLWSQLFPLSGRYLGSNIYVLYLPVALGLLIGLTCYRPTLDRAGWKEVGWVLVGMLAGTALGVAIGFLARQELGSIYWQRQRVTPLLALIPVKEMLYAGIAEEPLFRGFLWGALKRTGLSDFWIWIIQTLIFWLAHFYWFERSPVSFWIIVPLGGIVFGWLAWRSRSIGVSMIAHGLANGVLKIMIR